MILVAVGTSLLLGISGSRKSRRAREYGEAGLSPGEVGEGSVPSRADDSTGERGEGFAMFRVGPVGPAAGGGAAAASMGRTVVPTVAHSDGGEISNRVHLGGPGRYNGEAGPLMG